MSPQYRGRGLWARLCRDRRAAACMGILAAELLLVLLLPPLLGLEPNVSDLEAGFWAEPSPAHWLGTDDVGRDLFARLVYGGRISLLVGFCAAGLSFAVGIPLGLLAGYRRGAWEFWIMRLADVFQTFPSVVLVLCLVALLGPSLINLIGIISWRCGPWAGAPVPFCGATCSPTPSLPCGRPWPSGWGGPFCPSPA